MENKDMGIIHDEGFTSLTYNKEFDLWVLVIYYDTGSFNDTEIKLYRYYEDALEILNGKEFL
tara:strand:- start:297 stop:482 length:186 start_codon:yes stop_codon:yes gene_type:complete